MKYLSAILILLLLGLWLAGTTGCNQQKDKNIHRDKDRPKPTEPGK